MDKIFSARIDESVLLRIGLLAHQLHTSKKQIIESAVRLYAETVEGQSSTDIFEQTCGAWKRKETAQKTVERARQAFRDSMSRHRP